LNLEPYSKEGKAEVGSIRKQAGEVKDWWEAMDGEAKKKLVS